MFIIVVPSRSRRALGRNKYAAEWHELITDTMFRSHIFHRYKFVLPTIIGCIALSPRCVAQTTISISPSSSVPGATVAIPLTLSSTGIQPAAVQVRLAYAASDIVAVSVAAGPTATAAGKTVQCSTKAGSATCVVSGMNAATMGNGVVATASVQLASTVSVTTIPITLVETIGASVDGKAIPVTGTGAAITVMTANGVKALTCANAMLASFGTTSCTVTLAQAAPMGGAGIVLSSSNTVLNIPATVSISAGGMSASFAVTASAISATTGVQLTARWNATAMTTTVSLVPGTPLSGIACAAPYVFPTSTATCTVTLASAAVTNTTIALKSSQAQLIVPSSVVINQGSTTANVTVQSGSVAADAAAQIVATIDGKRSAQT